MQVMTFTLGGCNFGIPVSHIAFVDGRKEQIEYLSNGAKYIRGIMTIRDLVIPVYNLAWRFGLMEQKLKFLIVTDMNGLKVGFEVDNVNKVIDIKENETSLLPAFVNKTENCFKNVVSNSSKFIFVLDVNHLLNQEEESELKKIVDDNSSTISVH